MTSTVVGRETELATIGRLLDSVTDGPAVLLLVGEAGIGKSTLWQAGVRTAERNGFTVLAARPTVADMRLSYAGLSDLLTSLDPQVLQPLPAPQRRALDAALLRGPGDDPAPDPRAVAAGSLTLINELATTHPLLLALDDAAWLDAPTRHVLQFTVRRCTGPIAVLATHRGDLSRTSTIATEAAVPTSPWRDLLRPRDADRLTILELEGMPRSVLHHLVELRIGRRLTRHALSRLWEASAGNPFFALELARISEPDALASTALPERLRDILSDRLTRLPRPVRDALLVASALASPDVDQIARALDDEEAANLLAAAEDEGVATLSRDGTVAFTHPLFATGLYSDARPSVRRELHRRLGEVVTHPEERARHLALGAIGPDPATIDALDAAADHARRRGAPAAAAELRELCLDLGAADAGRRVQAAQDRFSAGDPLHARRLLDPAIDDLPPGSQRAEALALAGTLCFEVDNAHRAALGLLERALVEAGDEHGLRASIALGLAYVSFNRGRTEESFPYVETAVRAAELGADDGVLAEAIACRTVLRFLGGDGFDEGSLHRALGLERPDRTSRANTWPTTLAGLLYGWSHRFEEALSAFERAERRCRDQGADSEVAYTTFWAVPAACAVGSIDLARRYVDDLAEEAQLLESRHLQAFALTTRTYLAAWLGQVEEARRSAHGAVELLGSDTSPTFLLVTAGAAAMGELAAGDHAAAAGWLIPAAMTMTASLPEPRAFPIQPDAVEALLGLGRVKEAHALTEHLSLGPEHPSEPWRAAVGARCRGLVLAAEGHSAEADDAFAEALAAHDRLPQARYDRARTLLVSGKHHRRRNRRRLAKASLEEAEEVFDRLGCQGWSANARGELERLGLQPRPGDHLTPTEELVADLAASGKTVREVASTLFVSPKTVEAHLTRIYRKLGIHSRAELGRYVARREKTREPG